MWARGLIDHNPARGDGGELPELETAYQQAFDAAIAQAGIQVEYELRAGVPVPLTYYRANQVLVPRNPREQLDDARAYLTSSSVGITNWADADEPR